MVGSDRLGLAVRCGDVWKPDRVSPAVIAVADLVAAVDSSGEPACFDHSAIAACSAAARPEWSPRGRNFGAAEWDRGLLAA